MKKILLFIFIMALASGCASKPLKLTNNVKSGSYEVLGEGQGSATGLMLFNFIPIGQNTRFEEAQQKAIDSKKGDSIINTVITENWVWAYIFNAYTTTIKGTVIKYRD